MVAGRIISVRGCVTSRCCGLSPVTCLKPRQCCSTRSAAGQPENLWLGFHILPYQELPGSPAGPLCSLKSFSDCKASQRSSHTSDTRVLSPPTYPLLFSLRLQPAPQPLSYNPVPSKTLVCAPHRVVSHCCHYYTPVFLFHPPLMVGPESNCNLKEPNAHHSQYKIPLNINKLVMPGFLQCC